MLDIREFEDEVSVRSPVRDPEPRIPPSSFCDLSLTADPELRGVTGDWACGKPGALRARNLLYA